jgi:hypothetical protein
MPSRSVFKALIGRGFQTLKLRSPHMETRGFLRL